MREIHEKIITTITTLLLTACAVKKLSSEMGNAKWGLEITWHGQSCFTLRDSLGRAVVIDPFDETVGYGRVELRADALFITHNHFDHNFRHGVRPHLRDLDLCESSGTLTVASGLMVTGLSAFHDEEEGAINGPNRIYTFVMGGLRCVHLGDLGQKSLTEYQKKLIGTVDVLFIPVGGVTTIDAVGAKKIVDELKPGFVFPMHYGNVRFARLDEFEKFTALFPAGKVRTLRDSRVRIHSADLTDKPVVYILAPTPKNY